MSETIKPGRYRHFKGKEYEVLYIATHSETREEMVVYRALYGERGVWVRPASMWNEVIERDGKTYRRFTYIGEGDATEREPVVITPKEERKGSFTPPKPALKRAPAAAENAEDGPLPEGALYFEGR